MSERDIRVVTHLLHFGFAPGDYQIKCLDCGQIKFGADKRSLRCEECAQRAYDRNNIEAPRQRERAMTDIVERLRHRGRIHSDGEPVRFVFTGDDARLDKEAADEITTLRARAEAAEAERDALLQAKNCECGPDELCQNLVAYKARAEAAEARIKVLEAECDRLRRMVEIRDGFIIGKDMWVNFRKAYNEQH